MGLLTLIFFSFGINPIDLTLEGMNEKTHSFVM